MISRVLASCSRLAAARAVTGLTQIPNSSLTVARVPSRPLTTTSWCFAKKFGGNITSDRGSSQERGRCKSKRGGKNKNRRRSSSRSSKTGGDKVRSSQSRGHHKTALSSDSGPIQSGLNWAKSKMDEMSSRFHFSNVRHEKGSNRFVLDLDNGQMAHIDYRSIGRNKIDMYHTEVPAELRGRGIGRELARGALEQAAATNTKVKLSCSYLVNYLNKFAGDKIKRIVEM